MTNRQARTPEPLLDIPAVADICGVSEKTIRRWVKAGDLPAARLGGRFLLLVML